MRGSWRWIMSRPVGQSLTTRVLVVARREPQEPIGGSLKRAGYSVTWADSGPAVTRSLERSPPHIVVVHSPALGHHETGRIVDLAARSRIPVLVLSRPDTDLTFGTLVRQIEALLRERRGPPEDAESLVAGTLVIDLRCHTAHVDRTALDLTSKEFELLCVFARQPGRVWSRQHLIDLVWGYDYAEPRVVTTHIGNLRKKLRAAAAEGAAESTAEVPCIETVWNVGYRLVVPSAGRSASAHPARPAVRSAVCDPGRLPFTGREREMDALRHAIAAAMDGWVQVGVIVGEAGIGKTRLADEFAGYARDLGARTYWGRCRDTPAAQPYEPWLEIVRQWEREDAAVGPSAATDGAGGPRPRAKAAGHRAAGHRGPVFSPRPLERAISPAQGDLARLHLFDRLAASVREHAEAGPLCLIIDDLHWADTSTLRALQHLLGSLREVPLMLVLTYRPSEATQGPVFTDLMADLVRSDSAVVLPLQPLSRRDVDRFVQLCCYDEVSPESAADIYRQTEGNPFLLTQLVRLLLLHGQPPGSPVGAVHLEKEEGVRHVVLKRLARLSPTCREALDAASVIGRAFGSSVLAGVLGTPLERLPERLAEALSAHLLVPQRDHPDRYRFVHSAFRDVIYDEIPPRERAMLHAEVGLALENLHQNDLDFYSPVLAHHFAMGVCTGCGEKAVDYCIRAGTSAAARFAWEEACAQWQSALALLEDLPEGTPRRDGRMVGRVYEDLARTYGAAGDLDKAIEAGREAARRIPAEETVWQARLKREQTFWLEASGRHTQAETGLMEARVLLGRPDEQRGPDWWQEWIDVQLERALPPFHDAELDELEDVAAEIGQAIGKHGTLKHKAQLDLIAWLVSLRRHRFVPTEETVSLAERLAESYRATDSPRDLFAAEGAMAMTLVLSPDHREQAGRHLSRHWELTRETQDVTLQLQALWALGIWERLRGQVEATRTNALQTLSLVGERPIVRYGAQARGNLSWVAWRAGDLGEARTLAEKALSEFERLSPRCPFEWHARWTLLGLDVVAGDPNGASKQAQAILDPSQQGMPGGLEVLLHSLVDEQTRGMREETTVQTLMAGAAAHGYL